MEIRKVKNNKITSLIKMQNTFSFTMMVLCIALSMFCIYKIVTMQTIIIRANYIFILILSIFLSVSFYNDYLSITVDVTKVEGTNLYYTYNNIEKRIEIDPKEKINVKVGDTIVLYLKNKEYYLPTRLNKRMYHAISFLLFLVCGFFFIYTKSYYSDSVKGSGL
jgi:hypothetical protein